MKTLVVDVAADKSGALSILNSYYKRFCADTSNEYLLCVSTPEFSSTENVSVKNYPWVKRSWLHRLWFDFVVCRRIIRRYGCERILSLENLCVPGVSLPQTVYLHQPLPFVSYRFHFYESRILWFYQNIISHFIYVSLKKADRIIVQTEWMRQAVMEKCHISKEHISLEPPALSPCLSLSGSFHSVDWDGSLFYPATPLRYKNHLLLFQALLLMQKKGLSLPTVYLTITKEQLGEKCRTLAAQLKPYVQFLDSLSPEKMSFFYSRTALVFPSYVETYGLPLLEARTANCPILASDCPFCHEILNGYGRVSYFDPFDAAQLAARIEELCRGARHAGH